MVDYSTYVLHQVAVSCPEFESAYDSPFSNAGRLYSSSDGIADRVCDECTHWNQGTCKIFLDHKNKYTDK